MAEAAAGAVTWKQVPVLQEQHMMHICWIWQVLVPRYKPAITPQIAAELWMIFRAKCHEASHDPDHTGPVVLPMEVKAIQSWTKDLWLLYTQMN